MREVLYRAIFIVACLWSLNFGTNQTEIVWAQTNNPGNDLGTVTSTYTKRNLRVINDLYDKTDEYNNAWGEWNAIVRVRIANTISDALNNILYEKLEPRDIVSGLELINDIPPKYNQSTSYRDFDVVSMQTTYYVFIQTGFWRPDQTGTGRQKILTSVLNCAGNKDQNNKYAVVKVFNHVAGDEVIRASIYLPQHTWWQSSFCKH